ncbi:uncharacterized protein [Argopecten irradians]|uniref:uncharacterized protein isoform X2 n=1 Tax=Argopecten irradians TaxID=31199 RepID=UPI0037176DD9
MRVWRYDRVAIGRGINPQRVLHTYNKYGKRTLLRTRWEVQDATYQGMMLNTRAEELHQNDTSEILSYLPVLKGLDVVELGSGIGRFTGKLAERAKHVLAVDFVAKFIEKNKELNNIHTNIDFVVDDVMNITLAPESIGFVFTNWLFMYLDDVTTTRLLKHLLRSLSQNACLFVRESCLYGSGDLSFDTSTTHYREYKHYEALFHSVSITTDDQSTAYCFRIVMSKSLDSYREKLNNENQIIWLLQKVIHTTSQTSQ